MLVKFGPWVRGKPAAGLPPVHFAIRDTITVDKHDRYSPDCEPEDWNFARQAALAGARVMATHAIGAVHVGIRPYPNHGEWGEWQKDEKSQI